MRNQDKTKEQLLSELKEARRRIAKLEEEENRRNAGLELMEKIHWNPGTLGNWSLNLTTGQLVVTNQDGTAPPFSGLDAESNCQIHPDDLAQLKKRFRTIECETASYLFVHRLLTPAGDVLTLAVSATAWLTADGEINLHGAFRDLGPVQELMQNLDIPGYLRTAFFLGCSVDLSQLHNLLKAWHTFFASCIESLSPILEDENVSCGVKERCWLTLIWSDYFRNYFRAALLSAVEHDNFADPGWRIERAERFFGIDPIFVKDSSFKYVFVNDATCKFFELPKSKILGFTDRELLGEESDPELEELGITHGMRIVSHTRVKQTAVGTASFSWVMIPVTSPVCLNEKSTTYYWGLIAPEEDIEPSRLPEGLTTYPSTAMHETMFTAHRAAKEDCTVLLTGETGSGKDHVAKWIHDHSHRARAPYFAINLGGLSSELADSELFGHEKGAFTGAHCKKRGQLELAEGGTLLLNEIGDLSLLLQTKLLTFLDTKEFVRLGGEKPVKVNARLIAATNRDLEKEVKEGRFRKDLFYRINVMPIRVPPLRERCEDVPILTQEILDNLREERGLPHSLRVRPNDMREMRRYDWPGGVRELRNLLERGKILSQGSILKVELPSASKKLDEASGLCEPSEIKPESEPTWSVGFPLEKNLEELTRDMKKALIYEALFQSGGNISKAAPLLNVSRDALNKQIKSLKISVARGHTMDRDVSDSHINID